MLFLFSQDLCFLEAAFPVKTAAACHGDSILQKNRRCSFKGTAPVSF